MTHKSTNFKYRLLCVGILLATASLVNAYAAAEFIPTGMNITPTEASGSVLQALNPGLASRPAYVADHAVDMLTSPDGKTLLVLTSGYNRMNDATGQRAAEESNEYVFIYDLTSGKPVKKQVIQVPNTFNGIVWNPNGTEFYVSGGVDDNVHVYSLTGTTWAENGTPIALGHNDKGEGLFVRPMAAGLSINAGGTYLLVANYENDSISLVNLATRAVVNQLDLRPGRLGTAEHGTPGGTFPFAVKFIDENKAYITSVRDREIVVVNRNGEMLSLAGRIKTVGQPNKMTLNKAMTKLFVASDNDDSVLVVDTLTDAIIETIPTIAPKGLGLFLKTAKDHLKGANPNNVKLSPDESTLYVTNGGTNSVAVIKLAGKKTSSRVIGLIPTGWYPSAVATNSIGNMLYVINAKGVAGPNPDGCRDTVSIASGSTSTCNAANQYVWQLEKAGLLTLPAPDSTELARLTMKVAENSNFPKAKAKDESKKMAGFLRNKIEHVIYIVKENRTYDQVLGDLTIGNGDPSLAILSPYSPNHKKLALDFFTLDNFYDSGETSGVGWNWTTAARTTDFTEKTQPVNYAGRGLSYDWEGGNRNMNVAQATLAERLASNPLNPNDADVLAGTADVAAPDSQGEAGEGYLWDAALRAGKTLRNYGFYVGNLASSSSMTEEALAHPFAAGVPQVVATNKALAPYTDTYFRGYDQVNADFYLYKEWEREFDQYAANGNLPNLSLVRFPHDHFGSFSSAKFGVNTIETQMADNDYAMALIIDKVAHSQFKHNTLVVIVEDDAQGGGDHVDPHRSVAYIVGPYVKQGTLISTHYTTVNLIHTMTEILGLKPLGLNDGLADFMDVFDFKQKQWTYNAIVPEILYTTSLPLPAKQVAAVDSGLTRCDIRPLRTASYWTEHMAGQNFATEDKLDEVRFNRALWTGLKGDTVAYPSTRSGADLRKNRQALLAKHQVALKETCNNAVASR